MLKKVLHTIIRILIYPFIYLIKLEDDVWIFGSWFGMSYSDNPKYFFEYLLKQNTSLKVYWITRNREIYSKLLKENKPVLYVKSIKGILYVLRAKVIIMSNNVSDIQYREFINPKTIKIQLWHGIPSKKIAFDTRSLSNDTYKKNPFDYDLFISTSELIQRRFSSAFRMDISKIPITGYPRTDVLFNKHKICRTFSILYAPTHRMQGQGNIENYILNKELLKKINLFCSKHSIVFKIKLHYHDELRFEFNNDNSNIVFIKSNIDFDIQEELLNTNILITDYSSIYFDFLLLNRPVIFSAFDLKEYNDNDQGNYEALEDIAGGPICKNWVEVLEWILKFKKNKLFYNKKRQNLINKFYKYNDGNNSQRVYEEIKKYIEGMGK